MKTRCSVILSFVHTWTFWPKMIVFIVCLMIAVPSLLTCAPRSAAPSRGTSSLGSPALSSPAPFAPPRSAAAPLPTSSSPPPSSSPLHAGDRTHTNDLFQSCNKSLDQLINEARSGSGRLSECLKQWRANLANIPRLGDARCHFVFNLNETIATQPEDAATSDFVSHVYPNISVIHIILNNCHI